jgi:hypothetical protein
MSTPLTLWGVREPSLNTMGMRIIFALLLPVTASLFPRINDFLVTPDEVLEVLQVRMASSRPAQNGAQLQTG